MSYLLDTNILAETRKRRPHAGVMSWISTTSAEDMYVCAITVGEIERGIARLRARHDEQQASALTVWFEELLEGFGDRLLAIDRAVAHHWSRQPLSQPLSTSDGLIAATAATHHLTLVTRNVKDFERSGVPVVNPFELPEAD
jgi:toxin FitB